MPKEDYLLKYLEKLSRVIAAMLGFREKGFPEEGLHLADETYKEMLDIDLDELVIMPVEAFIEKVRKENYNPSYLETLARLTHETANTFTVQGNEPNAKNFYLKCLHLYRLLNEKDKTFSFERELLISELEIITQ
ncbi:MAG: hypothetical protein PHT07_19765 [Paludibacter sp.]|nr:hypothetical protein [Paludibacter sp.]